MANLSARLGAFSYSPSPHTTAVLALLGGVSLFGTSTVVSKAAINDIPPLTLAFARFVIALAILLILCRRRRLRPDVSRNSAVLGVTGIAIVYVFQNVGLRFTSAANAVVLIEGGVPAFTALLGMLWLHEQLRGVRLVGLAMAMVGVCAIAFFGRHDDGFSVLGSFLPLGAAASFSVYSVLARKTVSGATSLPVLTGSTGYAVLLLLPCALIEVLAGQHPRPLTVESGLLVLYLSVGCSTLTQVLWAYGVIRLEVTSVAAFAAWMPVIGLVAAAAFLGEPISGIQTIGALCVVAGLYLVARGSKEKLYRVASTTDLEGK